MSVMVTPMGGLVGLWSESQKERQPSVYTRVS